MERVVKESLKNLPIYISRVIRDSLLEMLKETTYLINECLQCGIMPDAWKIGYVTPMPKGSSNKKPGDWRPVSVQPLLSKLLERIVHNLGSRTTTPGTTTPNFSSG